jgi:hypothetical protein
MEKIYIIGHCEDGLSAFTDRASAEEILIDIYMDIAYEQFCYLYLDMNLPLEEALNKDTPYSGGFWIEELPLFS